MVPLWVWQRPRDSPEVPGLQMTQQPQSPLKPLSPAEPGHAATLSGWGLGADPRNTGLSSGDVNTRE